MLSKREAGVPGPPYKRVEDMTEQVLRRPFQHAFLVNDLEDGVAQWVNAVGAGPFFHVPHDRTDWFRYRGENIEADVSYAFGYAGDTQIQLIEQHDDKPSIYREMYEPGETGFHHIGILCDDYARERQRYLDKGFEIATELRIGDASAIYFDTRAAIGGYTEFHDAPDGIDGLFGRWKRAHDEWDGRTDPLRPHRSRSEAR